MGGRFIYNMLKEKAARFVKIWDIMWPKEKIKVNLRCLVTTRKMETSLRQKRCKVE